MIPPGLSILAFVSICACALGASLLTFFSGFGLGTLLTPVVALFFPITVAIALTSVVHLLNSLFKVALTYREIDLNTCLRFGLPAAVAALGGAIVLNHLSDLPALAQYTFFEKSFSILPLKLVIAILIVSFTLIEFLPRFQSLRFETRYLSLGGILSGFFGGLSGHQGALRSAFLSKLSLTKEQFVATNSALAAVVDLSRLSVYATYVKAELSPDLTGLLLAATAAAFWGAYGGSKALKKMTYARIQTIVSVMLVTLGVALGMGLI